MNGDSTGQEDPAAARDAAWAWSGIANSRSREGDFEGRVEALECAVSAARAYDDHQHISPQAQRDRPLHLSNLAASYLDAGRPLDALGTMDEAIDAEAVAVEVGAELRTDTLWVRRSLLDQRDKILRSLGAI